MHYMPRGSARSNGMRRLRKLLLQSLHQSLVIGRQYFLSHLQSSDKGEEDEQTLDGDPQVT
jgi:hypothetical protein